VKLSSTFLLRKSSKVKPDVAQEETFDHHLQEAQMKEKRARDGKGEEEEDDEEPSVGLLEGERGKAIQAMALRIGEEAKARVSATTSGTAA
jgi:hypothetical protein